MQLSSALGIFGGTFDPIHNGHIFPITEAAKKTKIQSIALTPCFIPNHKSPATVSSLHRLKMAELICQDYPIFHIDNRDIIRAKPTVSLDTLRELRLENPDTPLCFFIGSDSLHTLPKWYKFQELFSLCHFIVCHREGQLTQKLKAPDNSEIQSLLAQRHTYEIADLHNNLAGHIYLANTQPLTLSSSHIRQQLANGQSIAKLVPDKIYDYIQQHKLYQPRAEI